LSLRDMAKKHSCSHSAIANRAGRHGWVRCKVATDDVMHWLKAQGHEPAHQSDETA